MSTPVHTAILNLLHEHDCVIVPSLGAFLTRPVSSSFDERRGIMTPPSKEVAFNADIRHSDGVLADYLATTDSVDFATAQASIDAFAADVQRRLDLGEIVMLPTLGSLSVIDGRTVFEPVQGLNVLVDSYGLSPISAVSLRSNRIGKAVFHETRKVAASAIAVVALLCVSPRTADPDFARADMSALLAPSNVVITPAAEVVAEPAPVESVESVQSRQDNFCLVVASFLTRQEAQDYIASMRARGVDDLSILEYEGRCRVIAASFDNEDRAKAAARDIRSLQGFEKAWVLRVD